MGCPLMTALLQRRSEKSSKEHRGAAQARWRAPGLLEAARSYVAKSQQVLSPPALLLHRAFRAHSPTLRLLSEKRPAKTPGANGWVLAWTQTLRQRHHEDLSVDLRRAMPGMTYRYRNYHQDFFRKKAWSSEGHRLIHSWLEARLLTKMAGLILNLLAR